MNRVGSRSTSIAAAAVFLARSTSAFALNPARDVRQYAHKAWKISDGVFKGVIFNVAQTPDGYLWIGTDSGLVRFDGVRSLPWQPPTGTRLPSSDVRRVYAARDGRLWIGTVRRVASWKDGTLTRYPELDGQAIEALFEDRQGTIWIGSATLSVGRLCSVQRARTECYGADLLLGYASSYTVQTTPFSPHLSYSQFGSYIQDDWRLTPSVTANVGLRWAYCGRPVERDDRIASFDLATGQQVFPGQHGYPGSLVGPDYADGGRQDHVGQ
jgi:ligand-binding sensor domain-containing protein